jgi:hypothetical protein
MATSGLSVRYGRYRHPYSQDAFLLPKIVLDQNVEQVTRSLNGCTVNFADSPKARTSPQLVTHTIQADTCESSHARESSKQFRRLATRAADVELVRECAQARGAWRRTL